MTDPSEATLVKNAIHNPNEPRHFMRIVPAAGRRTVTVDGNVVADSDNAVVVKEVGADIYDPILYFPRADVAMHTLQPIDKSTHCPLKGDTEYFDFSLDGLHVAEVAWSYVTLVTDNELLEMVAFDPAKTVTAAAEAENRSR